MWIRRLEKEKSCKIGKDQGISKNIIQYEKLKQVLICKYYLKKRVIRNL